MSKTTVIYHSADFDGIFCREIARKFLGNEGVEYIGWDFGNEPLDASLLHSGKVIIMDLPVDRVFGLAFRDGWICKGAEQVQPIDRWDSGNITWIDHHKSSIETHPTDIPGYRIDGVSACRLAWQWFQAFQNWDGGQEGPPLPSLADYGAKLPDGTRGDYNVDEPLAVKLAGEYDIWDHANSDNEDLVFQFGLRSQELTDLTWRFLLIDDGSADDVVRSLLENGRPFYNYQSAQDAGVVNYRSFMVEFEGLKFLALNTARCNSVTFAAKDVPETGHDALMGFFFNGTIWKFSLYGAKHRPDIDLSAIAKKYGGGGHKQACGFESERFNTIRDADGLAHLNLS